MTHALGRAGLVALLASLVAAGSATVALAQDPPLRQVIVIDVPGVSFEDLLGVPEVLALARSGGAALMSVLEDVEPYASYPHVDPGGMSAVTEWKMDPAAMGGLDAVGAAIRERVGSSSADEVLVIVMSRRGSARMAVEKDDLHALVMAVGAPDGVFVAEGEPGSLTSDTTRREGVVTDLDVDPTVGAFLGAAGYGGDGDGSTIRVVDASAPFELHERYLAQRRLYVPVGTAGAIYLAVVGLLGVASLALGARVPERARRAIGWGCLSAGFVGTGLLAAGHLPELTYAAVVPFLAIVVVLGTMAFSPLETRGAVLVPVGLGAAILAFFAVETLLGWSGMLTPLLGGTHLDGGRFYGLPNVGIGLLVGASLYVAQALPTRLGAALVAAVALLAGMPYLGSNLGGGITLFATAGLWLAVRERGRLGAWRGIAVVGASLVGGTVLLLLAHRLAPLPTHVTRFAADAGGLDGVWRTIVDRLAVGIDLIRRNPAALVPVVGLPVALAAVLRPPAAARAAFERWPAWHDAVLVCLLGGVVAYLANDTGAAAAGFAFGLGLGGMLGVSLLAGPGKMVEP